MKKSETKPFFEKAIGVFAWLSFALAVFMAAVTFFASLSGQENGKEIFGSKMLIITGDSMSKSDVSQNEEIFFNKGDLIVVKSSEDVTELKIGDVITFISQSPESLGKTVTHKIKDIRYSTDGKILGFITYGINTGKTDTTPVKPELIIGKYSFKVPNVGNLFLFLKTPRGYYLSILIPTVLLIIFFSITVGKILGKQELAKNYNEELEALKIRVSSLEELIIKDSSANEQLAPPGEEITEKITCEEKEEALAEEKSKAPFAIPKGNKASFKEKLLSLEEAQVYFNKIHNELISYKKVHPRLSFRCISYRFGRKLIAKMTVKGKTLKLHLDLNVADFNENVYFQKDLSSLKAYSEVPFTVKIKSRRAAANAAKLTDALAEKFGLKKNESFTAQDGLKLLYEAKSDAEYLPVCEEELEAYIPESAESTGFKGFPRGKKISFEARLKNLNEESQTYFSTIHNELTSYNKVHARFSFRCISYRYGRKLVAKMTVKGKTLKLHLALDAKDFNENVYFHKDFSSFKAYSEVPFTVKIKSPRGISNALKLTDALAAKHELQRNSKLKTNKQI